MGVTDGVELGAGDAVGVGLGCGVIVGLGESLGAKDGNALLLDMCPCVLTSCRCRCTAIYFWTTEDPLAAASTVETTPSRTAAAIRSN